MIKAFGLAAVDDDIDGVCYFLDAMKSISQVI